MVQINESFIYKYRNLANNIYPLKQLIQKKDKTEL
ncbi:hypothetical protein MMC2321_03163 [Chitinophaga sp. MM2321]